MSNRQHPILGLLAIVAAMEAMGRTTSDEAHGPHGPGCNCTPEGKISRDAFRIIEHGDTGDQALLIRYLDKQTGQPCITIQFVDPDSQGAEVAIRAKFNSVEERDAEFDAADSSYIAHALMSSAGSSPF